MPAPPALPELPEVALEVPAPPAPTELPEDDVEEDEDPIAPLPAGAEQAAAMLAAATTTTSQPGSRMLIRSTYQKSRSRSVGARGALAALLVLLATSGCGYHLVHDPHGPHDPAGPFTITSGPAHTPDAALAAAAEEGARAELSRAGELAPAAGGAALAEIEIELVRVEETSEGVALASPDLPLARATRVTVIGRARVHRATAAAPERDTGEVRASEAVARIASAGQALIARDEGGRTAARRLGEILVRRLLGFPEPGEP